jgi:peptidase A4-like protein
MPRQRSGRRSSRSIKRWWAATAVAVSLSVAMGVIVFAVGHNASQSQAMSSAFRRQLGGWGHGGNFMLTGSDQQAAANDADAQVSQQARQQLSVRRETPQQFKAAYERLHAQQYRYFLGHKRVLAQQYRNALNQWRHGRDRHHVTPAPTVTPPPAVTPTATPTAGATTTTTATPTATPTATATTMPVTTPTATPTATATATSTSTATATATPTATTTPTATATTTPTTTTTATATATATPTATATTPVVTQATSPNWAGYAATGAAGTFTSVAANWIVPPVVCSAAGQVTRSSYAAGLDGDGTGTIEQIGTEGDCNDGVQAYSGWFQVSPNAPVFFANPVKPGDVMTASVTALGGGNFMLTLFDMTQNWTQITPQAVPTATQGSAEIVAQDPSTNGAAQPLADFGIVDFLGAAINNAAITAPINQVTMVSAAGNTLAVPSTITGGGVGNFAVGWDAAA